jgi:transcriptional regulator with XRE-family HTH domain
VNGDDYLERALQRARAERELPRPAAARRLRRASGLSQSDVARALGAHPSTISNWEHGRRAPTGELLNRYRAVLERLRAEVDRDAKSASEASA